VARQSHIQPVQRFAFVFADGLEPHRPSLADIAATMRATAAARGVTTEVFDAILAQK
jgi:hypothetical protein